MRCGTKKKNPAPLLLGANTPGVNWPQAKRGQRPLPPVICTVLVNAGEGKDKGVRLTPAPSPFHHSAQAATVAASSSGCACQKIWGLAWPTRPEVQQAEQELALQQSEGAVTIRDAKASAVLGHGVFRDTQLVLCDDQAAGLDGDGRSPDMHEWCPGKGRPSGTALPRSA